MTHASFGYGFSYPTIGFASRLSSKTRSKRKKERFTPTEDQVLAAVGCIQGRLCRLGDAMTHYTDVCLRDFELSPGNEDAFTAAKNEAIRRAAGELVPHIFSRGSRLGRDRHEVAVTIQHALKRGVSDGKFIVDVHPSTQMMGIKLNAARKKRHKYLNDAARRSDGGRSRRAA